MYQRMPGTPPYKTGIKEVEYSDWNPSGVLELYKLIILDQSKSFILWLQEFHEIDEKLIISAIMLWNVLLAFEIAV